MAEELIPYVILEENPDYKRSKIDHRFGVIEKRKLYSLLLIEIVGFICDKIDIEDINNIEDIKNFWHEFCSDAFMSNKSWSAMAFINGEWKNVIPSNEDIFEVIILHNTKQTQELLETDDNNHKN